MILIDMVTARQILNSRGEPAVEAEVVLNDGTSARASTPSGKSKSSYEAVELVDKDFGNYFGQSVEHAVNSINEIISPRMKKLNPGEQAKIDQILIELDGTPNMAHLGTNATLAVSIAMARVAALSSKKPLYQHINELFVKVEAKDRYGEYINLMASLSHPSLPIPAFNLINGGEHADSTLPIQEYLVFPVGIARTADRIRAGTEIWHALRGLYYEAGKSANVGDQGGLAALFTDPVEPFKFLAEAVKKTNYNLKNAVIYGVDCACANLDDAVYNQMIASYPIVSLEDPYKENDFDRYTALNQGHPDIFCTGDALLGMQVSRLYTAIERDSIDCAVIQPNALGTITETLKYCKVAKFAGIALYGAARSGETNDDFIIDLSAGVGAKFVKAGAPIRGERVAKYNRLMEIAPFFEE
jgi:enolase